MKLFGKYSLCIVKLKLVVDLEDSGDVKKRKVAVSYTLKYDSAMKKRDFLVVSFFCEAIFS